MGYDENANQKLVRSTEIMDDGMALVDLFVNKNYLIDMDQCEPVALESSQKSFSYLSLFEISKIVYDPEENINDKLVSVYSALCNFGSTALLLLVSDGNSARFFLGTRDERQPTIAKDILQKGLKGNFPGIHMQACAAGDMEALLEARLPREYANMAVSAVSVVPSTRSEDRERFVQGLEKFIDSMSGETYTAICVAVPLDKHALESQKRGYEELYSALSQCAQIQVTYGQNESEAIAQGVSESFSRAVNIGISDMTGQNAGESATESTSRSHGGSFGFFDLGFQVSAGTGFAQGAYQSTSSSHTRSQSDTWTEGQTASESTTTTAGRSATLGYARQNKTVQVLLERIDAQLERIKRCESYGLWNSACYFVADRPETAMVAANTFKALVAGEQTGVENSFISLWDGGYDAADKSLMILDCLRYGLHPRFTYVPNQTEGAYAKQTVSAACLVSGVELPLLMGFPRKSVSGIASITSAEFGRDVYAKGRPPDGPQLDIGAVYHMGEVFESNRVRLDTKSLASHCFITGSTGAGKSNATYRLIDALASGADGVRFLVIEPAKGEYKLAFGGMPGINIFSTNPAYCDMLRVNPFAFGESIHVLEHLDRLIEIFSACWPLYAAMPALLKASFEEAYIRHGWDLNHSMHMDKGNGMFPTFQDVAAILPTLLNRSEYSANTKGDYIGSLVTRIESLTNGLLGQIFAEEGIEDRVLFDENTIVDLSRIGSAETKALLMGVLVLKLSEYRQAGATGESQPLRHVTVLEEAHNLLKRTSQAQGQETANVQGKAVEMISNAIAEMRTYGEGFVIVDQSPTAVDVSAIKNTNTKIILRLPEADDCEAVGRSIGLSESQIRELSRLERGVAAIYQNDWLQAVLTRIDRCSDHFRVNAMPARPRSSRRVMLGELLQELVSQMHAKEINMAWLNPIVSTAKVSDAEKKDIRSQLLAFQKAFHTGKQQEAYAALLANLLHCGDLFRIFEDLLPPALKKKSEVTKEIHLQCMRWRDAVCEHLEAYAEFFDAKTKDAVFIQLLLHQIATVSDNLRYKLVLYCIG